MLVEDAELLLVGRHAAVVVPALGELGDHAETDLRTLRADPERRVRPLQRLRLVHRVRDREILAHDRGALLGPHRLQDAGGVGHAVETLAIFGNG